MSRAFTACSRARLSLVAAACATANCSSGAASGPIQDAIAESPTYFVRADSGERPGPDGPLDADAADSAVVLTPGKSSGTRLRAVFDVADQARNFVLWRDTKLGIDCTFGVASDGATRCLPQPASLYDSSSSTGILGYGDPQCQTRVVAFAPNLTVVPYVVDPSAPFVCGVGPPILATGSPVPVTMLYANSGGTCAATTASLAGATVVTVGAAVDPSLFVGTRLEHEPRGERLSADVLIADDGARQVANLYDMTRAAACAPATDTVQSGSFVVALGNYACLPSDLAVTETLVADSACTVKAASHSGYTQATCGRQPTLVEDYSSIMPSATYFEVGPQLTTPVYDGFGSCTLYTLLASAFETFYGLGAAAPWSTFAPLSLDYEGAGRIAIPTLRTQTGELADANGFFDVIQNRDCYTLRATDGKNRCLSYDNSDLSLFADSACTTGILNERPGFPIVPGSTLTSASQPGGATAVFKTLAKIAAPTTVWRYTGTTCVVDTGTSATSGDDFYSTTSVAPTDFVEVVRQVE